VSVVVSAGFAFWYVGVRQYHPGSLDARVSSRTARLDFLSIA
jgi:hypothetical protein